MIRACIVLLLASVIAGAPSSTAQTFRSNVQGVRVDVLVTDRGRPLGGLTADDFELYDNGVRQPITLADFDQLPLNVVLAFDVSRSLTSDRLEQLRRAAGALIGGLSQQDQAGLITFTHAVALPHGLTRDLPRLRHALARVESGGGTALVDGVYAGITLAESAVGRALLIVFSDGVDTSSWLTPERVLQIARRSDVVAYGVSVGRQKPEFLRDLVEATGGQVFESESAENLEQRFLAMLDEFRRRYVLMYTPTSTDPGWHRLEVRVKGRRATVQARPGYLADPIK
jgi:VWFA-related protein